MAEKIIVDIQNWPRREHYHYFGELDDPYFGITAKADFTSCYRQAKQDGESFFLYSLHKILQAVNAVEEIPRISTGKLVPDGDRMLISVSVEVNHGLADGYHVAQFFKELD